MRIRWRELELPNKVVSEGEPTRTFGRFSCEPFERGFGITLGNSLRRVLLSSLEGSAVTKMKLRGAQHEFTSLEGVQEDVTEIALNVKSLVVRIQDDKEHSLKIIKEGPCVVTAADIAVDAQVEVINPDLVIAHVTGKVPFELEMVVKNGRGYVPAMEPLSASVQNIGRETAFNEIPLDAAFSPVIKVKYEVVETRVVQKTNYECLILEVTTDGSVSPEMALVEAAKILRKHLNPFIQYNHPDGQVFSLPKASSASGVDPALEQKLSMMLTGLKLSSRSMNCLEARGITTVGQLVTQTDDDLLEIRNFGETSLNEVKHKLGEYGLRLGMRVPAVGGPPQPGIFN
ncbi:MAG: DNA-directed RNA polymerase subunit alpha [Thermoguttaceae bacterium]|jgi:DNA-directed RNA polymerase subunit alpha